MPVAILSPGTAFVRPAEADADADDVDVFPPNVVYSTDGVILRVAPQFNEPDGTVLHSSLEAFLLPCAMLIKATWMPDVMQRCVMPEFLQ